MLTRSIGAATLWCLVPVSFVGALQALQEAEAQRSATLHLCDVNGDGLDDALVVSAQGEVSLLANRGEGRFEDVTATSGLGAIEFASCALFADFDGDGRVDLFVGSSEQRLWRNDGKGVFSALASGIEHDLVDLEAHALDHDRDGRLDLVLHTEAGDLLYRNAPTGRFERVELPESDHPARSLLVGGDDSASDAAIGSSSASSSVSAARRRHQRWLRLRAANASTASNAGASGGSSTSSLASSPTIGATSTGPLGLLGTPSLICAGTLADQATGNCIEASSIGVLGSLHPLSSDFFVDSTNSRVGVGTSTPLYTLHVAGKLVSGVNTSATGLNAAVGGGASNSASGAHAAVAGGESNTAGHSHAFIGGGLSNTTLGTRSVIGGGISNRAGNSSVVGGGSNNEANFNFSTVAGGRLNKADATYASIVGGASNSTTGQYSFVGGGGEDNVPASGNVASGLASSIVGGRANAASGDRAAIGGGSSNQATSQHTSIAGGRANSAFGAYGAIPGGELNTAAGSHSLAAGRRAKALHDGSFVWGDSTDLDFSSSAPDQFLIRASGGVGIDRTPDPAMKLDVNGAVRASDTIEATSGGFKFPDGSVQASAAASLPSGALVLTESPTPPGGFSSTGWSARVQTGPDTWSAGPTTPLLFQRSCSAVVNDKWYVFGGEFGSTYYDGVWEYDSATSSWSQVSAMPTGPRSRAVAVAIGASIYVIGGWDGTSTTPDVLEYQPASGAWSVVSTMPSPAYWCSAAASNGRIYVFGGLPSSTSQVWEYDPIGAAWTSKPAFQLGHRQAAVSVNDRIFVIGGIPWSGGSGEYSSAAYEYLPATSTWRDLPPLPQPRYAHTAASIGGRVLVLGGATCTATSCRVSTVLEYDVAAPQGWTYRASLLELRTNAVAAFVGGALQLAGGFGANNQFTDTSEIYDPQTVELHYHRKD